MLISSRKESMLRVFVLALYITVCNAFRWHLDETFEVNRFFTFSERFMFATGKGPLILEQGASYIDVDVTVSTL